MDELGGRLDGMQLQLTEIRRLLEQQVTDQAELVQRFSRITTSWSPSTYLGVSPTLERAQSHSTLQTEEAKEAKGRRMSRSSVRIQITAPGGEVQPVALPTPQSDGASGEEDPPEKPRSGTSEAENSHWSQRWSLRSSMSQASLGISAEHRIRAVAAAKRLRESRVVSEMEMHSGFRWARWREYARDFVEAPLFSHLILVLIIFNVILLGVEVDVSSHVGLSDVPSWMQTANTAIVGVFLLELLLKFIALGCTEFWCAKDSSWNLFDFVIIAISVADVALDILATSLTPDVNTGHLRLIRSIRLARALRSMRMLWLFQYIGGLRTLALSIVSTLGSLFWTLMLLLIIFYSFGVVLTQMVVEHCRYMNIEVTGDNNAIPVCPDDLKKYWSSVPTSMLTLFMSITGGLDWEAPVRPLWGVSRLAVVLVLIFVAITVFAILNAVTGVFCNTAIESAASDKEVASMRQVQSKAKQVDTLRGIFQELDRGKTNELSIEDIHQGIEEGELSNFLESIGISTGDVWTLFMLLDSDQQGCIDLEEFVNGCMQLHGPAKSMQMAKMSFENKITRQSIKQLSKEVRTLRQCLTALLSPSKELF